MLKIWWYITLPLRLILFCVMALVLLVFAPKAFKEDCKDLIEHFLIYGDEE